MNGNNDSEKNKATEVTPQSKTLDSFSGDLASLLETLEDLTKELGPRLKKVVEEIAPTMGDIKTNLDKDETLLLVERLTANTNALLDLVELLEATKDLAGEIEPRLKLMMTEINPVLNRIKASVDKDETLLLVEKLAANTGTFLDMLSMLEAIRDFIGEINTNKDGLMSDLAPKIKMLRMYLDDEEFWGLMGHMFVLKKEFAKLFENLVVEDEEGNESAPLVETSVGMLREAMIVADSPVFRNMITSTASAVSKTRLDDVKPVSILGALSTMRDKEVQKALGFLVYILKQMGRNL